MKNLFKFCLVATMIFLPFSCDQDSIDANPDIESFNKASGESADFIVTIADGLPYANASATILRNKRGVTTNFNATGLEPGAYTIWVVVFNNRSYCGTEPCGEADLFIEAVEGDVLFGTGHVVGENGKGNFSSRLNENDESGSISDIFGLPMASGLHNAQEAEVHLVLRYHGPAIPGKIDEQIHTYEAGCGDCEDILAAIFIPK